MYLHVLPCLTVTCMYHCSTAAPVALGSSCTRQGDDEQDKPFYNNTLQNSKSCTNKETRNEGENKKQANTKGEERDDECGTTSKV